jgi:hypothetical protein
MGRVVLALGEGVGGGPGACCNGGKKIKEDTCTNQTMNQLLFLIHRLDLYTFLYFIKKIELEISFFLKWEQQKQKCAPIQSSISPQIKHRDLKPRLLKISFSFKVDSNWANKKKILDKMKKITTARFVLY